MTLSIEKMVTICCDAAGTLRALADLHECLPGSTAKIKDQVEGYRKKADNLMILAAGIDTLRQHGLEGVAIGDREMEHIEKAAKWSRRDAR